MTKKTGKRFSKRETFTERVLFEASLSPSVSPENPKYPANCTDMSAQGLGLTTEYELKRSQVIKLDMPLKETGAPVPVFAEVVWTMPTERGFRAGLRFLTLAMEKGGNC